MAIYSNSSPSGNRSASQHPSSFAQDAVYAEFRPRDARALSYDGFKDRAPGDTPRPIGEVVAKSAGQASLDQWLKKAAKARSAEDREVALATAREIARLLDLPHAELIGLGVM